VRNSFAGSHSRSAAAAGSSRTATVFGTVLAQWIGRIAGTVGAHLPIIGFKDGDVVRKGALLFMIDPTPTRSSFDEGTAQIATARARLELAKTELARAQTCKKRMQELSRTSSKPFCGSKDRPRRHWTKPKRRSATRNSISIEPMSMRRSQDVWEPISCRSVTLYQETEAAVARPHYWGPSSQIDPIYLNFDMS